MPQYIIDLFEKALTLGARASRPLQARGLHSQSAAEGCPFDSQDLHVPSSLVTTHGDEMLPCESDKILQRLYRESCHRVWQRGTLLASHAFGEVS